MRRNMDAPTSRYSAVCRALAVLLTLLLGETAGLKLSRTEAQPPDAGAATPLSPCFSVYPIDLNETALFTHIGSPESADCAYTFEAPEEASLELEVGNIRAAPSGGAAYGYSYSYSCGPQAVRIFDFRPDGALVVAATWCGWPVQGAALRARSSRNLAVVTSTVALGSFDLRVSAAPLPGAGNATDLVPVPDLVPPPPPPSSSTSTRGDTDSTPTEEEQLSAAPTAAAVVGAESEPTTTTTTTTTTSTTTTEAISEHESPPATTAAPPRAPAASSPDENTSNDAPGQSPATTTAATAAEASEGQTQPPPPLRSAASAL